MALMTKLDPGVNRKERTQRIVDLIRDWKIVGGHPFPQKIDTPNKTPTAPAFYVGWQVGSQRIGGGGSPLHAHGGYSWTLPMVHRFRKHSGGRRV